MQEVESYENEDAAGAVSGRYEWRLDYGRRRLERGDVVHGAYTTYTYGCRCEPCREARRDYDRVRPERVPEVVLYCSRCADCRFQGPGAGIRLWAHIDQHLRKDEERRERAAARERREERTWITPEHQSLRLG